MVVGVEVGEEQSWGEVVGGLLGLAHEWTSTEKTHRSYELWARYVAPRFQGQAETLVQSRDWIEDRMGLVFGGSGAAQLKAFSDAGKEVPEAVLKAIEGLRRARDGARDATAR